MITEKTNTENVELKDFDIFNTKAVLNYGLKAQEKISEFTETILKNVSNKDLGEIGESLAKIIVELKGFEIDKEKKGFLNFFSRNAKKGVNKLTTLKANYNKTYENIDKIIESLEYHQITLMNDVTRLDEMYQLNKDYFTELTAYIESGKKKLESIKNNELVKLQAQAVDSNNPVDAQAVKDMLDVCNRFEKKIHDLELTRTVTMQMGIQIRLIQNSDIQMSEKIQSTITNTIPLWKNQMVIAVGINNSQEAAKTHKSVVDMTNHLLNKNAETLKMATINTAKEVERGIVDMQTLKNTNNSLISTLDEVLKIQEEGKLNRRNAERELIKMEDQLKERLLKAI